AHHAMLRGAVKPKQPGIRHPQRNRPPRAQILRELCVVRSRKAQPVVQAVAPGRKTERPFRVDRQRLGLERLDLARELPHGPEGNAYLRICRTGERTEVLRGDELNLM